MSAARTAGEWLGSAAVLFNSFINLTNSELKLCGFALEWTVFAPHTEVLTLQLFQALVPDGLKTAQFPELSLAQYHTRNLILEMTELVGRIFDFEARTHFFFFCVRETSQGAVLQLLQIHYTVLAAAFPPRRGPVEPPLRPHPSLPSPVLDVS